MQPCAQALAQFFNSYVAVAFGISVELSKSGAEKGASSDGIRPAEVVAGRCDLDQGLEESLLGLGRHKPDEFPVLMRFEEVLVAITAQTCGEFDIIPVEGHGECTIFECGCGTKSRDEWEEFAGSGSVAVAGLALTVVEMRIEHGDAREDGSGERDDGDEGGGVAGDMAQTGERDRIAETVAMAAGAEESAGVVRSPVTASGLSSLRRVAFTGTSRTAGRPRAQ